MFGTGERSNPASLRRCKNLISADFYDGGITVARILSASKYALLRRRTGVSMMCVADPLREFREKLQRIGSDRSAFRNAKALIAAQRGEMLVAHRDVSAGRAEIGAI